MKILLRILLSVIGLVLVYAMIDYYFNGAFKYILWGITSVALLLYNDKKNCKLEKTKDSKYYTNES